MMIGVDKGSAFNGLVARCLYDNGYRFVVRYLDDSWGQSPKCIKQSEVRTLHENGLSIFLVFETTGGADGFGAPAGAAYFTRDQGIYDATHALTQARNISYPSDFPIFFAVDYDAQTNDLPQMVEYWNGVYDILTAQSGAQPTYTVGIYGSYRVVKYAADSWPGVTHYWQTYAWSGGLWDSRAHIRQTSNHLPICGDIVDYDESNIQGWMPMISEERIREIAKEEARVIIRMEYGPALAIELDEREARAVNTAVNEIVQRISTDQ